MKIMLQLSRYKISLMVAASCFFGFVLYSKHINFQTILATTGAFILASACSILNQIQEIETDKLMKRTSNRPLPQNKLSIKTAIIIAIIMFIIAELIFFSFNNTSLMVLSIIIIIVYNGIYTPLKTKTSLSLLLGATVGSFPPLLGWVSAGGNILSFEIITITLMFYLWQTPHFWLLAQRYQSDYKAAGIPIPTIYLPKPLSKMLTAIWLLAYISSIFIVLYFTDINFIFIQISIIFITIFISLVLLAFKRIRNIFFHIVNISIFIVVSLITLNIFI